MAELPREIGGYEVQRVLGSGGMATVYAALQKQPRRTVAVKVLRAADRSDKARRRFQREIEILGRLRHPNIAQVYTAGVHGDLGPYFVMEYVPRAKTITEHAVQRKLSRREILRLFIKVCAAVDHGHQSKIVHLDLKPGNVLVDEAGEVKVIDFGIAHAAALDLRAGGDEAAALGTLQYMAPEQLEETPHDLDARCDVWALGVLLYKLLTGRPPHDLSGLPLYTAVRMIREEPAPRPGSLDPSLRGDLESIVLKALAKDRGRRYRSAGSLGRDVLRYLGHVPVTARRAGFMHRVRLAARRRRELAVVVGGAAIALPAAVIAALLLLRGGPAPPAPAPAAETGTPAAPAPADGPAAPALPLALRHHEQTVWETCFDSAGAHVASLSVANELAVWSLPGGSLQLVTHDHEGVVEHVVFDLSGPRVITAANDGRVLVTDLGNARVTARIAHEVDEVRALAVSPDGARVAVAGGDLTLRVLDAAGAGPTTVLRGTSGAFEAIAFSHDGTLIGAGSAGGRVTVWDVATSDVRLRATGLSDGILAIAFDEADRRVLAIDAAGKGAAWELAGDGRVPDARFASVVGDAHTARFDTSGRWLAVAAEGRYQVIDAVGAAPTSPPVVMPAGERCTAIAVSDDGAMVAIGTARGGLRVVASPRLD